MKLPVRSTMFPMRSLSKAQHEVVVRAWSDAYCDVIVAGVQHDQLRARRCAKTCRMLVAAFQYRAPRKRLG